ncbi:MAG: aminopeptidase [Caldilineaceae bacterium]
MNDPRIDKLADTLVNYCTSVGAGDWVYIEGHVIALPLVEAVTAHVLRAGGNPTVNLTADGLSAAHFDYATEDQLRWLSPFEEAVAAHADARIMIRRGEHATCPTSTRSAASRSGRTRGQAYPPAVTRQAKIPPVGHPIPVRRLRAGNLHVPGQCASTKTFVFAATAGSARSGGVLAGGPRDSSGLSTGWRARTR